MEGKPSIEGKKNSDCDTAPANLVFSSLPNIYLQPLLPENEMYETQYHYFEGFKLVIFAKQFYLAYFNANIS